MLLVYNDLKSKRLKYVLDFILKKCLGLNYQLTEDSTQFRQSKAMKINYSSNAFENELFIKASGFLAEKSNINKHIKVFFLENVPAFFPVTGKKTYFSCDPFAIIFFMLSRYEEYQPYIPDAHGRFPASESLALKNNFMDQPIVDLWRIKIAEALKVHYPNIQFESPNYVFQPSYDIDYAWAYLHKGFFRSLAASAKDLIQFNFKTLKQRFSVYLGKEEDPYNTFSYLDQLHQNFNLNPIFFILLGKYGKYDKNISRFNQFFQHLLKGLAQKYPLGMHPSYRANEHPKELLLEKKALEEICQKDISDSRQHYLKVHLPTTYRRLIEAGIKKDYSMGFASCIGFRAGTSHSFLWYDLEKESITELEVQPFQIMDVSLNTYLKLKPQEAIEKAVEIIKTVKNVNGTLSSIWHNNSFSEQGDWIGWRAVYETFVKEAQKVA